MFTCITSGTISQADSSFGTSSNVQCVAISVCAGTYATHICRNEFTSQDIDEIIIAGDAYYRQTKLFLGPQHKHTFLCPDEVYHTLQVGNNFFKITVTYAMSGLYAISPSLFHHSVNELATHLNELFVRNTGQAYIFLGLQQAVSFWKKNTSFYLLNSHSVDLNGRYCLGGVGRLFQSNSVDGLALLLLQNSTFDTNNPEYEVYAIKTDPIQIRLADLIENVSLSPETSEKLACDKKIRMKPVVILKDVAKSQQPKMSLDIKLNMKPVVILKDVFSSPIKSHPQVIPNPPNSSTWLENRKRPLRPESPTEPAQKKSTAVSKKKVGRPSKKRRGRPKKSTLTKDEQSPSAIENDVIAIPIVHLDPSNNNQKNNPRTKTVPNQNKNPGKHLPKVVKRGGLICQYQGEQLNSINLYELQNPSLRDDNCLRCNSCGSRLFYEEKGRTRWCCGEGDYNVMHLPPLKPSFYNNPLFIKNARLYNDVFAFCALVVPQGFHHPKGLSFIKILGRTYHKVNPLYYKGTRSVYIDDADVRLQQSQGCRLNSEILLDIFNFLSSCNPYIPMYKRLHDEPSEMAHLVFELTNRSTHGPVLGDRPQSTEVAAVISCDDETHDIRKVCIWKKGENKSRYINIFHPLVEPFQYPLLYPHGSPGWHIGRLDNSGRKMTQLKYLRCLLLSDERFSKFGRLSETWLVDMFARLDEERLQFIRHSQLKGQQQGGLRIAPADEIQDNFANDAASASRTRNDILNDETIQGENDSPVLGRVFLPRTYTGGPRYMRVSYFDAMAIVSRLGGPTYFLTFTAYGGWKELKLSKHPLSKNTEAHICGRVFYLKLKQLLRDIRCGTFFGKMAYIVWVIEFQMRGLPHTHICFRVDGGPVQNHEIDQIIRADIPAEYEANGRLRALVLKHMIHGPCGPSHRTDFPCWDNKLRRCSKLYPKPANNVTFTDERGFVHYRRDSENEAIIHCRGREVKINDTWVVPYNAALLLRYGCHINLEISSAQRVVKYLFKYISKGAPLRRVSIVNNSCEQDEVEDYITKRYIGASDAAWRIMENQVSGREPTVEVLPVHLENKHMVIFHSGNEHNAKSTSTSKLLIYFNRPIFPVFDKLTYLDFYENFIIHSGKPKTKTASIYPHPDGKHYITPRRRGDCVARMYWVSPHRSEQFYLRLLLTKFPCRGYTDLYSLGGTHCSSFHQAAIAVGLADDHCEYITALQEASTFLTGTRLRNFFVILCTIGAPASDLWSQFKSALCEDFIERHPGDDEMAFNKGLIEISRSLRRHGSSLLEVGLPDILDDSTELGRERLLYCPSLQKQFFNEWEPKLSDDQKKVVNYLKSLIPIPGKPMPSAMFIDGPGGSGKTLLLKVISAYYRSLDQVVLCVATSGIAALNLSGGATAHSMFRIPLDFGNGTGYWAVSNGTQRADLIKNACAIIFDEAPMAHAHLIGMLDRSLRDLMQNDFLFGGKILIFAGDFRQIPPIIENAKSASDIVNISPCRSHIWSSLKIFKLTTAHRTSGEHSFTEFLMNVGSNSLPVHAFGKERLIALPNVSYVTAVDDLLNFVFPDNILKNPNMCAKRAILCNHNINVKEINEKITNLLAGEYHFLYSADSVVDKGTSIDDFDDALLHHAQGKGVPDHVLKLKVDAVCMITRNLNFDLALVNGTKVIIVAISRYIITVRKPGENDLFAIPRITFKFPIFPKSPIEMMRKQFPLQPCYAISVHKSQGQTIEVVGLDLRTDCFTHGQLYVALSRVRSPLNLKILVPSHRIIDGIPYTRNVVFEELL